MFLFEEPAGNQKSGPRGSNRPAAKPSDRRLDPRMASSTSKVVIPAHSKTNQSGSFGQFSARTPRDKLHHGQQKTA